MMPLSLTTINTWNTKHKPLVLVVPAIVVYNLLWMFYHSVVFIANFVAVHLSWYILIHLYLAIMINAWELPFTRIPDEIFNKALDVTAGPIALIMALLVYYRMFVAGSDVVRYILGKKS